MGSYRDLVEVEACTGGKRTNDFTTCHLWEFRFGTDPNNVISEAKREQGKKLCNKMGDEHE